MNNIFLIISIIFNVIALIYIGVKAKKQKLDRKRQKTISEINETNKNERIISCPSCSQQIKFRLPIKGNNAQCRKCSAQFKLDVDSHSNIYITEIKIPEDANTIKSLDECYGILEVKPDAIPIDIRAAYKKRISEYHPDKVEHLGNKIKHVAEEETRRVNAAYAMLHENERV